MHATLSQLTRSSSQTNFLLSLLLLLKPSLFLNSLLLLTLPQLLLHKSLLLLLSLQPLPLFLLLRYLLLWLWLLPHLLLHLLLFLLLSHPPHQASSMLRMSLASLALAMRTSTLPRLRQRMLLALPVVVTSMLMLIVSFKL